MQTIYGLHRWQTVRARAIRRDDGRCTVSRLLGGDCSSGPLHAHHIRPMSEGGSAYDLANIATTCASHHPVWEALRRRLVELSEPPAPPRCRHQHRSVEARAICEARLARQDRRPVTA